MQRMTAQNLYLSFDTNIWHTIMVMPLCDVYLNGR
jgi:hypothetical protein